MKTASLILLACAAVFAAAQSFAAEPVVRVKAKLTGFDGQVMRLEAKPGDAFTVSVLPETRYVRADKIAFDAIKPGDYAGAAVSQGPYGLTALDVYSYAQALRGTGEGRFPEGERLIINGVVSVLQLAPGKPAEVRSGDSKQSAVRPSGQPGMLTLHYRGAVLSSLGRGRTLCEGRASPPAYASALACEGDATITVPPGTQVSALTVGDKGLLVPGSLVTVAMTKGSDGKNIAPGVIVEVPSPVEKPQSPQ